MPTTLELEIVGAGGEPVDLRRTFLSHGLASLPPYEVPDDGSFFKATIAVPGAAPRSIRIEDAGGRRASITIEGRAAGVRTQERVLAAARHILRLDEDLSPFYEVAADDPDLAWVARGAGRWIRSATVFEDLIKTVCTTNCSWGATVRMVGTLTARLGEPVAGVSEVGAGGRAFPTPAAMAEADEVFYKEQVRAGYRAPYLRAIATAVACGELNVEAWGAASARELPDDELAAALVALPGVGPYAAAHMMMLLGRYSRLILDSWTRPKYARLVGRAAADRTIERRFRRFGPYAGLAFWLFLTRDWADD